jgi:signal transduction histidine kinase
VSIRLRLAAWYAGSILVLFLLTGFLLRLSLRETLVLEHHRGATRSAEVAQGVFRAELAEYRSTPATLAHISAELVIPDQALEFMAPAGSVFTRIDPPTLQGGRGLDPPLYIVERPLDPALAPGWTVRVHASMAPLEQSLRRIDRSLLLIVPLTVLLAAVTGGWLTGRTLRPVGAMAAAAEAITPAIPGTRIPVANPRDELGRLASRFNDLLGRLESALVQQRRFLAEAAHELRTPMARLLSQAEVGLSPRASDAAREEALRLIRDDLVRASGMVGELLQLARVDAGEPAPPLTDGFLDDVIAAGIPSWYAAAEQHGVTLHLVALEETPARLNPELVTRLLGILLDNAIRYTPAGGRVEVGVAPRDGHPVLEVRDTGIGIPPEDREQILQRFFRGRQARQFAPEGSGLGLSIAHWIVEQHGGALELTSPPEGGTRARVTLPESVPPRS